jgi:hypothetical protein
MAWHALSRRGRERRAARGRHRLRHITISLATTNDSIKLTDGTRLFLAYNQCPSQRGLYFNIRAKSWLVFSTLLPVFFHSSRPLPADMQRSATPTFLSLWYTIRFFTLFLLFSALFSTSEGASIGHRRRHACTSRDACLIIP